MEEGDIMRGSVLASLLLACAASCGAQEAPGKEVSAPATVPVVAAIPLQAGLSVDVQWTPLRGRPLSRLYRCRVVNVTERSVEYRTEHQAGSALHVVTNRVDNPNYTGDWSETRDDQLPHTWPWIGLEAGKQLQAGEAGQTTVTLVDLLAGERRSYLYVGTGTVPCLVGGQPALVPCWTLVSGNGATISVMASAENPLTLQTYEPGASLQRTLAITGPTITMGAPGQ